MGIIVMKICENIKTGGGEGGKIICGHFRLSMLEEQKVSVIRA